MGGGPPGFPPGYTCPMVLWILPCLFRFRLRDYHPLWSLFPKCSTIRQESIIQSATPVRRLVWPLPLPLAATQGIDFSFSSYGYLDVSVPRVPSAQTMYSSESDGTLLPPGSPIRISTNQCLLAAPRSLSQLATSFVGVWCHGIHPVLLLA